MNIFSNLFARIRKLKLSPNVLPIVSSILFLQIFPTVSAHDLHPLRIAELKWKADGISKVYVNAFDVRSGAPFAIWNDLGEIRKIDGRSCLAGPYFMFDVDDNYAFDIDETVTVELLFDRTQSDGFIIDYDHATQASVARKIEFENADNNRWHRETVTLEHAGFANRRLSSTDLSVAAPGSVLPYDPDSDHTIVLCGIKITRSNTTSRPGNGVGGLDLEIRDALGDHLTAARVSIFGSDGRMPIPSQDALPIDWYTESVRQVSVRRNFEYWPDQGGYAFYVDGSYTSQLAADTYDLVVVKGPEYRVNRQRFRVEPGKETNLVVTLNRWTDLPTAG